MKKISLLQTLLHSLVNIFYSIIKSWRWSFLLSTLLTLTVNFPLSATENDETTDSNGTYYTGAFAGSGKAHNTLEDVEGFANWGYPGSSVDYDNTETIVGVLIGKKIYIDGIPLRIEIDGTVGDMSASTNQLDPKWLDETAKAYIPWVVTVQAGVGKDFGPIEVFLKGGVAVARIFNSVTDIDFSPDRPPWEDTDDSFRDDSIQLGLVIGVGAELPLSNRGKFLQNEEGWVLRMEASHINFGEDTYEVNHSGNNRCGPGGPRKPCLYNIKNELNIFRVAIIRHFSL